MKQLVLIRHAKSSWKDGRLSDHQRPLNKRGSRNAVAMGHHLRTCGSQPQRWLCSTATRALQTSQLLAQGLGTAADLIEPCEALYTFDANALLQVIRQLDDQQERVWLVGHNPAIAELAERLTATALGKVPTCAVLEISLALTHWQQTDRGCGRIVRFDYPKKLTPPRG